MKYKSNVVMHSSHRLRTFHAIFGLAIIAKSCTACIIFEFADSGFAANAVHLLHAVPIFDGNNGTLFLDNTKFAYKCSEGGGWHDFFGYQDILVPWSPAKERAAGEACNRLNFRDVDDVLHLHLHAAWAAYDAAGISQAWIYQPWVKDIIDKHVKELEEAPRPIIGFHVRWGDKLDEDILFGRPTTQPRDYVTAFTRNFPDVKGGTCVVAGDTPSKVADTAKVAKELIGCKIMDVDPYYRADGHLQKHYNDQSLDKRCESTVQLLIDIEELAHADYMTGTLNSGIPYLIEVLRYTLYGKERRTFVDASFKRSDWWQRVRDHWNPATEAATDEDEEEEEEEEEEEVFDEEETD